MNITTTGGQDLGLDLAAFPAGFVWGAATAAYQIEGAANEGGRGPSIWDTFAHTPGRTLRGDTGDTACDHYHRWESDLDLVAELGLTAYRLSLSWSRLQPAGRGPLNPKAIAFYRQLLAGLRERGVRPFVTLYHWDLPQPLEDAGGWPMRATAERFAAYAGRVVAELGDLADDWVTLNEPWCSALLGYGTGKHAPGRTSYPDAVAAAHHLNLAHGLAVLRMREQRPGIRVGVTHLITDVVPASSAPADLAAAARTDADNNLMFLDPVLRGGYPDTVYDLYARYGLRELVRPTDEQTIATPIDFLGVNHYQQIIVSHDDAEPHLGAKAVPAEPATTSLRWSVKPESLRNVLLRIATDYPALPLYVTENGASFDDHVDHRGQVVDPERIDYLRGYFQAAAQAVREGVDLQGYFVWSLMDNFEWAEGYSKRFGLIYVDYSTQRRTPKASAGWYRYVITRHTRTVGQNRRGAAAESSAQKPHHTGDGA
ncbi:GH1 family beta-glucosidase [Micromonospora thermarum]|uniref:Beta-glucosidase n=1 Tax=Micromonospora thermarum TaxID=2720024 RepID=A0ABX0ZEH7_9ACTN|nr:GH1 family beta-glucosidase [Micromonospora thermarum]NJP35384.1 beta-glucosidase [Micromonospora thermarum]